MKNLILLALALFLFVSCNNSSDEIAFLKEQVSSLQYQNEQLCSENTKLKKQLETLVSPKEDNSIQQIGRWLDNRPGSDKHIIIIFKNLKTKKYFIKHTFGDGSSDLKEARFTKHKGLNRYEPINNEHNEYCIVEKNGDLSMWSQNGKFATYPNY